MTRNLKALGLALLAVFAMSAVAASGASAAEDTFTSEVAATDLTGTGGLSEFRYTPGSAAASCKTATFDGTIEGEDANEITVHPTYENDCTVFGVNATIDTEDCNYVITGETDENEDAAVHIECDEPGDEITITGPCTIHIPPQTPTGGGASFANNAGDVEVKATVTGITSTITHSFACTLAGIKAGTHTNGSYIGEPVTVKGYEDGEPHDEAHQVGISVDTR
jgi:hypothetical protein